jgi:hypothetical protein
LPEKEHKSMTYTSNNTKVYTKLAFVPAGGFGNLSPKFVKA